MTSHSHHVFVDGASKGSLNCAGSGARRKTKLLATVFYVIIAMWVLATFLLYVVREESVHRRTSEPKKPRNVFDQFNAHEIRFRGLTTDEEDYTAFGSHDAGPKEMIVIQVPRKRAGNRSVMDELGRFRLQNDPLLPKMDCTSLLNGDADVIDETALLNLQLRSKAYAKTRELLQQLDNRLIEMTSNCTNFMAERKYITESLTPEERAYPLAYVITVHKKFSIFERLLRSIYHPQNLYCIHVDKKSDPEFIAGVRKLSECFGNVFVASKLVEVHYSHWSRVQADLNCLEDLVKRKTEVPWKYVLNLCGQDFPLKTNMEIVRALKSLHGFNNLETMTPPEHKKKRFQYHYKLPDKPNSEYATMERTDEKKTSSPLDTPMFVGSAYFLWKRQAVEFMLSDDTIAKFFAWNEDAYSPDEHMWATLQRWYPKLPGSFPPHEKYDLNELQSVTRLVKWGGLDTSVYPKCAGRYGRGVCIYGVGDLPWLLQQHHLFANKFDYDVDPFAVDCLDVWLRNRTLTQTARYRSRGYL